MKQRRNNNSGLVYSSDAGKMCPSCGQPTGQCRCKKKDGSKATGDGVVRVSRETKGRKGKGVTLITGLSLAGDQLQQLAKDLKARCGAGGTVKDGVIEIQGEHRDTLVQELINRGFQAKRAGG
ncbi:MAG: translation initiation factor Sui1 [Gemmatimonadetes bacterium]|nr:translation initiation factor Sui1 [Gemmatimonadota bacterium]MBT6150198.1 translation initiation factor Sui1 [Gemmatimonadota bacterium]MBT7863284.1 translation initiation factor Sui1 [Gemmatimonadota bacterium]